jgi:hypothetical protein
MPVLTKAVFFVFAVFVPILLLNMLIAMMGNTYQLVISRSAKEWKRQVSCRYHVLIDNIYTVNPSMLECPLVST